MWHIIEHYGRRVAQKVDQSHANYLKEKLGGEVHKNHTPKEYLGPLSDGKEITGTVLAYASTAKPVYNYPLMEIWLNGELLTKVTRKEDAIRILHALKRDYKEVVIRV